VNVKIEIAVEMTVYEKHGKTIFFTLPAVSGNCCDDFDVSTAKMKMG
jgi:hypothetical protein